MTFIKELISRWFNNMFKECCAPSTNSSDFGYEDEEESKLSMIAKMTTFDYDVDGEDDEYQNNHSLSPNNDDDDDKYYNNFEHQRDLTLISGFIHELEEMVDFWSDHLGVKPILDLCFNYYYIQQRGINYIYLLAEQAEQSTFPSLDHSDDEDDDDDHYMNEVKAAQNAMYLDNFQSSFGGIYCSEIINPKTNKFYCNIYELEEPDQLSIFTNDWIIKFAAISTTKDIILPSSIHKQLIHQYHKKQTMFNNLHWNQHNNIHQNNSNNDKNEHNNKHNKHHLMREYNVIFKLCGSGKGGWSDICSAVIVDETHLNHKGPSKEGLFGFNWRLPSLPVKTGGNGVCFSKEYGLISVGGYKSSKVHRLSFNSEAYFEQNYNWVWDELPAMNETRWFPSCTMIENGDNGDNDKLIAMAGSSADHEPLSSVECFDFNSNTWSYLTSCNNPRKYGGLASIKGNGNDYTVYLGGGDHATQSVEYYDLHKNQWYNLPNTQLPHRYYPNLWKEEHDDNMLYISCSYSNSIESIDLRSNESSWNVVCGAKLFQTDTLDLDYNQFRSVL